MPLRGPPESDRMQYQVHGILILELRSKLAPSLGLCGEARRHDCRLLPQRLNPGAFRKGAVADSIEHRGEGISSRAGQGLIEYRLAVFLKQFEFAFRQVGCDVVEKFLFPQPETRQGCEDTARVAQFQ